MTDDDAKAYLFARDCMTAGQEVVLMTVIASQLPEVMLGAAAAANEYGTQAGSSAVHDLVSAHAQDKITVVLSNGEPDTVVLDGVELLIARVG